nr:MAG: clan AA aspartic protease, AF_0612 family [Candidatus Kentron sp. LFY]
MMGVFTVPVKMRNLFNDYLPEAERGEDVACEAMVDTGAAELALPAGIVERMALRPLDTVRAYTADGNEHEYRVCGIVELEVQGRKCHVRAIELPRGANPLLGAVPLEEMDWRVAPQEKKLFPNPKSPDKPLLPLC